MTSHTIRSAVRSALYSSDTRQSFSQPHHVCTSGLCTWPPLPSIGMCTTCKDITDLVIKSCNATKCTLSLPKVEQISLRQSYPEVSISYEWKNYEERGGEFFKMTVANGGKASFKGDCCTHTHFF